MVLSLRAMSFEISNQAIPAERTKTYESRTNHHFLFLLSYSACYLVPLHIKYFLTMKEESTLSNKLASYSALASVVLMVSKSADAQIIYTDVIPDDTINVVGSYQLDLNNDGTTDFQFNLQHGTTLSIDQIRVVASASNAALRATSDPYAGYYYASALNNGALIDGNASFDYKVILASHSGGYFGNWIDVSDRFLGLKLVVNSNTYYGWARLSVNAACNQLIVHDYAVDTIANEAIAAGDKCGNYSLYANTLISPADSVVACEGVILATDSIGGAAYQWLIDGTLITGATNFSYTASSTGNYSVIFTNAYGCVDTATATHVTLFLPPAIPLISQDGDTLMSTAASSYQWYANNVIIPGATAQTYTPPQGGDYTVQITDAIGCTSVSDPFTFIPIGISNTENQAISLFEANNVVTVQLNDTRFLGGEIKIFNALGSRVYFSIVHAEMLQIDLNRMPRGIYLLTVEKNNLSVAQKIAIQ